MMHDELQLDACLHGCSLLKQSAVDRREATVHGHELLLYEPPMKVHDALQVSAENIYFFCCTMMSLR
jgi:hypothetical protein